MKLVKRRKESTYKLNKNGKDMLMNREEEEKGHQEVQSKVHVNQLLVFHLNT